MTQTPPSNRRMVLVVIALLVVAMASAAVAVAVVATRDSGPDLIADPVMPARDAPLTQGTDSEGRPVQVPTQGRPALVTFLFADCPDVCPTITGTIREALDRVGPQADGLDVVAVSVDPAGDTPQNVRRFLARHRMEDRMRYLIGSQAELEPIWKAWMVASQPQDGTDQETTASLHSARVVLVDREGRQAGAYPAAIPVPIDDLASDIRTLTE